MQRNFTPVCPLAEVFARSNWLCGSRLQEEATFSESSTVTALGPFQTYSPSTLRLSLTAVKLHRMNNSKSKVECRCDDACDLSSLPLRCRYTPYKRLAAQTQVGPDQRCNVISRRLHHQAGCPCQAEVSESTRFSRLAAFDILSDILPKRRTDIERENQAPLEEPESDHPTL